MLTGNIFITINEEDIYYNIDDLKVGETLKLLKDPSNRYDSETIKVLGLNDFEYGTVANSIDSVARGTHSAGYIYNMLQGNPTCEVCFIIDGKAIARLN